MKTRRSTVHRDPADTRGARARKTRSARPLLDRARMRLALVPFAALLLFGCSRVDSTAAPSDGGSSQDVAVDAADTVVDAPIETDPVVPAGARKLALEVNPPAGADYAKSLDEAVAMGVKVYPITLPWNAFLEKTPGTIDDSWIKLVRDVTVPRSMSLALSIPMVDTVSILAPTDLAPKLDDGSLAYDDPSVISRYEKVLDVVYATLGASPKVEWLVVSNEANVYLGSKPDARWTALRNFHDAIASYVKSKHPETSVTMSVTFGGISDATQRPKIAALVGSSDEVMTTYYFGSNGFGAPVGGLATKDLETMLAFAGSKPLVIKEWGYATGVTGNSLDGEAAFVRETFQAWDAHADRIPLLTYSRMWDGKRTDCEDQAKTYGFPGNEQFIQFLCTLGLRAFDGTDKPAFAVFRDAAKARGF